MVRLKCIAMNCATISESPLRKLMLFYPVRRKNKSEYPFSLFSYTNMSCSKIFSGDLPELIYEIIKYFHDDFKTLYSCILVNRLWCRLAIPLLWEDPFAKK